MLKKRLALGFAGLGFAALIGASFAMGFALADVHTEMLAQARASAAGRYQIESQLRRGWLTSTAETRLRIPAQASGDALELSLTHRIAHGPLGLGGLFWKGRALAPAVAVIDTRYDADPASLPNIAATLGERPLLHLRTWLSFDRSARLRIESPSFELEGGRFRTGGLAGDLALHPDTRSLALRLRQGPLRLSEGAAGLSLAGATLQLETIPSSLAEVPDGVTGRIDLGAFSVTGGSRMARVADSVVTFEGESRSASITDATLDLVLGDLEVFGAVDTESPNLVLRGLRAREIHQRAITTGLRSFRTSLSLAELQISGSRYGPGAAEGRLLNIDSNAWSELAGAMARLEEQSLGEEALAAARMELLAEHMPKVLGPSPELAIEKLHLDSPSGPLDGSARLGVDTSDPFALESPFMLMSVIEANIEMVVAAALLHERLDAYLASTVTEEDTGPVSDEEVLEMAGFMRMAILGKLLDEGTLILDADRYRLDARMEQGLPMLNGQPVDPSFLTGIVPGF